MPGARTMRGHMAGRIETLVFLAGMDAGNVKLDDLVRDFLVHLTLQIDEAAVGIQLFLYVGLRHVE